YNREFVRRWWNWKEFLEERSEINGHKSDADPQPRSGEIFIDREDTSQDSRSNRNAPHFDSSGLGSDDDGSINISRLRREEQTQEFETFETILKEIYAEYTFEFAANESGVDAKTIEEIAKDVSTAGTRISSHNRHS